MLHLILSASSRSIHHKNVLLSCSTRSLVYQHNGKTSKAIDGPRLDLHYHYFSWKSHYATTP
jgi:hypothetical protein